MNSTSRMISRLARHTPFQSTCSVRPVRHLSTRTMAAAHQAPSTIEVFVKGDGPNQVNGDCPFCQRVLITLQAKGLPYSLTFIDFENKPAWWVRFWTLYQGMYPRLHHQRPTKRPNSCMHSFYLAPSLPSGKTMRSVFFITPHHPQPATHHLSHCIHII